MMSETDKSAPNQSGLMKEEWGVGAAVVSKRKTSTIFHDKDKEYHFVTWSK